MWNIAIHGDWLEQKASSLITQSLPHYKMIWEKYIGHDGKGKMIQLPLLPSDIERQRAFFAESHYTILESFFLMSRIKNFQQLKPVKSFEDYCEVLNHLMVYQAYAGRIHDNIENCYVVLNNVDAGTKAKETLSTFYNHRHAFVHRKKLPFFIGENNLFHFAKPSDNNNSNEGVGKKFLWEDIAAEDMVVADEYMEESLSQYLKLVDNELAKMHDTIESIIKANAIDIGKPPNHDIYNTPISASTMNYNSVSSADSISYITQTSGTPYLSDKGEVK